jgi:soluble lytic murein transglycosylase-like protein
MMEGSRLVIPGALVASLLLGLFLFFGAAGHGAASPVQTGAESAEQPPVQPSPDCQVSPHYPESILRWCSQITYQAQAHGLDADLLAALIWQESGGDPLAYSHSGAVGLMQVMPRDGLAATFVCKNGPCFSNRPTISELQDPDYNLAYGTQMLKGLLERNGDIRAALHAYGPMDVGYSYADKVLGIYDRYRD